MQRKKLVFLIILGFTIVTFTFISVYAQKTVEKNEKQPKITKKQVLELLKNHKHNKVVELGEPAVPVLIEIVKNEEYKFPARIVQILGEIGDKRATPLLIQMLPIKVGITIFALEAIEKINDSSAEAAVLEIFENEKVWPSTRLLAGRVLLNIGGERSKAKVKELTITLLSLWEKAMFWLDDEAMEELDKSGFGDPEAVFNVLGEIICQLKDVDILIRVMRWGGGRKGEPEILANIGTPEAIEALFKTAENDTSMWAPNIPPEVTEKEREEYSRVHPVTRIVAVEALITLGDKVSKERLKKALNSVAKDYPEYKDKIEGLKRQIER
ncbi:hypothetical protein KAW48_09800 [candidate division WOR-3 bacterium]|nr:hypothetical protein [candidate division WOR-3 bacterium]